MRRGLGPRGTTAPLVLAALVVTAGPAEARTIGGLTGECVAPGHAVPGMHGHGLGANCICVIEPTSGEVLAGPIGPGSTCPAAIPTSGTARADLTPPGNGGSDAARHQGMMWP